MVVWSRLGLNKTVAKDRESRCTITNGTMCLRYSICIVARHLWANYDNMGTFIHYQVQGEKRLCKELRDRHLKSGGQASNDALARHPRLMGFISRLFVRARFSGNYVAIRITRRRFVLRATFG